MEVMNHFVSGQIDVVGWFLYRSMEVCLEQLSSERVISYGHHMIHPTEYQGLLMIGGGLCVSSFGCIRFL